MTRNDKNLREWSEQLEAGRRDDELLQAAARLEKMRSDEQTAPSIEFQRRLRRDLLNQYETTSQSSGGFRRLAGSLAGLGLLVALVIVTWLSVSSAGRLPVGDAPIAGVSRVSTPPSGSRYTLLDYAVRGGVVTESMQTDGGEEQMQSLLVPGMDIEVVTYWSPPPDTEQTTVFVHLLDSDEVIIAQGDAPIQAAAASDIQRAKASVVLSMPYDLAPGTYRLVSGLFDPATGAPLSLSTTEGEVAQVEIGEYFVSAGGDANLEPLDEVTIELQGSEATTDLKLQNALVDMLAVRHVSPASGTVISGENTVEFEITIDYALVSVPEANLDVRVTALDGESGRGIGLRTTVDDVQQGTGTTTVVVKLRPAAELTGPAELGLWIQFKTDERSAPVHMVLPAEYRWSYVP